MSADAHAAPLAALDAIVLDTETTGLDARTARIVQIAAVRIAGGAIEPDASFATLVDPGVPIPPVTSRVHGITDDQVRGQPKFAGIAADLAAFIGDRIVIGHAIAYDITILEREHRLAGMAFNGYRALDVRNLARLAAPGLADHGLDRLCEWLNISIEGRHTATGDAIATAKAFLALVPLLRKKGIRTLAEAEAATRSLAEREALSTSGLSRSGVAQPTDSPVARIDSFPYRHRVADVMATPPAFGMPTATVGDTIHEIIAKGISSVFVRAPDGRLGIVTERDLLRAIDAGGPAGLNDPIVRHMKAPLQTIPAEEFLYRAIGRIERLGFRHLGVVDAAGEIVGAVTTRNLLRHRASTALALGDEIDSAPTAASLAKAWAKLPRVTRSLLAEDVDALLVANVVSAEICAITRRAAELAEARMLAAGEGPPPVPYAVLVLGSAARGESQLAADQDNAIVYAEGGENSATDRWFATLATHLADDLDEAGIPYCKGGVMAKNRAWRMSAADWRSTIDTWVTRQRPEDLLSVDIFFDAVAVHGDRALADEIWRYAYTRGQAARAFQNLLVENARTPVHPFTLFGGLRVDQAGRIDLKRYGLMPIFTAARVLAIRRNVPERSSGERLRRAVEGDGQLATVAAIIDAQRTLLRAIIDQQLIDIDAGKPPSPRVEPARMSASARDALKVALKAVASATDLVGEGRL